MTPFARIALLLVSLAATQTLVAQATLSALDGVYNRVRTAYDASGKVLEVPNRITWADDDRVVWATRAAAGDVFREFTISSSNLTDVASERFEHVQKHHPYAGEPYDNRDFIRPSGPGEIRSPDGKWMAFVRDHNIWIRSRSTGEFQLSWDGTAGDDYVSLMWSPDSAKLAALREYRVRERQITLVESRPADSVHARARTVNYAKPGDTRFQRTPALFLPAERRQVPVSLADWPSQYEVLLDCWLPDSSLFTFTYVGRGFRLCRYGAVEAPSGKVSTLAEEASDKFVFANRIRHWWLADAQHFLWISRRDGWRHLYKVSRTDGSVRQLTRGDWNFRTLHRLDESANTILFTANGFAAGSGEDPYNVHLLKLDLATGAVTDLTPDNATHSIRLNPAGTAFTDYASRPDLPPRFVLRAAGDGRLLAEFPPIDISALDFPGHPTAEVFQAKGRDGTTDIWGTIWRPFDFDPNKKYPVVEYIYAGPHDNHVPKSFPVNPPRGTDLLAAGFVVVMIDGMGTDNRSRAFHEVCWRNLKDAGFPDRIPWMKAAAETRPWMDISRVGIFGYSAGGQNALSALLFFGDFYKAAVALCGCHDNRVDKLWWNEQWMGYPLGPWYDENSNVTNARLLKGDLMLINGELDDNVDPVSTLQVVDALVKANKNFEQLYLPGRSHDLGGEYIDRRILDFFCRKLKK